MDIGVHMLDMALHVLGEPAVLTATAATYAQFGPRGRGAPAVAKVRKTGVTEAPFDVEDLSTAFIRLEGGATLLLESSWAQWIPEDQLLRDALRIRGRRHHRVGGPVRTRTHDGRLDRAGAAGRRARPRCRQTEGTGECVRDFLEHVHSSDGTSHRGWQALARAEVVDACYTSAESGGEVQTH